MDTFKKILLFATLVFFSFSCSKGKYEGNKLVGSWKCYKYAVTMGKFNEYNEHSEDAEKYDIEFKSNGQFTENCVSNNSKSKITELEWITTSYDEIQLIYKMKNDGTTIKTKYRILSITDDSLILGYYGVPTNTTIMHKTYYLKNK